MSLRRGFGQLRRGFGQLTLRPRIRPGRRPLIAPRSSAREIRRRGPDPVCRREGCGHKRSHHKVKNALMLVSPAIVSGPWWPCRDCRCADFVHR